MGGKGWITLHLPFYEDGKFFESRGSKNFCVFIHTRFRFTLFTESSLDPQFTPSFFPEDRLSSTFP